MKKTLVVFAAALVLAAQKSSSDGPQFTPDGQLFLPKDYREWVYLSSGLGMTYGHRRPRLIKASRCSTTSS